MLTVVMTTRDRAAGLARTLDAYERLEAPQGGYRVIVADDGSRDETRSVLAARAGRLPLVVLHLPSLGQNAARNRALEGIEGDLVLFTDDDALPRPDWLVRMRTAADAHPEAGVIAGTVVPRFAMSPPEWLLRSVRLGPTFAWVERPADGAVDPTEAVSPSFAIRASLLAAGLRFDESIGPDGSTDYAMGSETELLLRLQRAGVLAWYVRDAVVEHVVTAAQVEESTILRRAYRYGRGRWRLGTSRLAKSRLRARGIPVAVLYDLLSRRLSYVRAVRRGDPGRVLRAAWRIAYLAGHVDEVGRERGREPGLGRLRAWLPESLREILVPRLARAAPGLPALPHAPAGLATANDPS